MDNIPIVISTMGRTAAGKTSIAKYLANQLSLPLISEATIKRGLKTEYSTSDSLDESLRDLAYHLAINEVFEQIIRGNSLIIDASFHKQFRRAWLCQKIGTSCQALIFLYCQCQNENKVISRLNQRRLEEKKAENQADAIEIYRFIDRNFDEPDLAKKQNPVCFIYIDTDFNSEPTYRSNIPRPVLLPVLDRLLPYINNYLLNNRNVSNCH